MFTWKFSSHENLAPDHKSPWKDSQAVTTPDCIAIRIPEHTPAQAAVAKEEQGDQKGQGAYCTRLSLKEEPG